MERQRIMKILHHLADRLANLKIVGEENVQDGTPYVVATSHISRLDLPFLMLSTHRQDVIGIVAKEYEKAPFWVVFESTWRDWISRINMYKIIKKRCNE